MPLKHDASIAGELARLRGQLAAARLRLFETEAELDHHDASDLSIITGPLRRFADQRPRAARFILWIIKAVVWTTTGELPRWLRAWRRARSGAVEPQAALPNESGLSVPADPTSPLPGSGRILIADESVCKPDQSAGSRSTMSTIAALREAGWAVTLWAHDRQFGGRYTFELETLGVCVLDARWSDTLERWLDQHGPSLDHVMLMRPAIARSLLPSILKSVTGQISYQGVDLHFARLALTAQQLDDPLIEYSSKRSLALERRIWRAVDVVLYLSEDEAGEVRRLEPGTDARVLTPYTFDTFHIRSQPASGQTILFVGGFAHPPNGDAVAWFVTEVFPLILRSKPNARFVVVGSKPPQHVRALAAANIVVAGQIDDKALAAAYDAARVAVAPLRVGAGVKGKVVEALVQGVPIVTSTVGAQGIPTLGSFVPVHDDAEAFAGAVVRLLDDDAGWLGQSAAQTEYAARHFSKAALRDTLFAVVRPKPSAGIASTKAFAHDEVAK